MQALMERYKRAKDDRFSALFFGRGDAGQRRRAVPGAQIMLAELRPAFKAALISAKANPRGGSAQRGRQRLGFSKWQCRLRVLHGSEADRA